MPAPLIAAVASVGLPVLAGLVGEALRKVDSPVARGAAEALDAVGDAVRSGAITPDQLAEANRHVETMTRLDNEREAVLASEINQTIRAEAAAEDPWTRRWRPFFGYVVASTWGVQALALAYVLVVHPTLAPGIVGALGEGMATMWWVALGVLGVQVVKRSEEKALQMGVQPPAGFVGRAIEAYAAARR